MQYYLSKYLGKYRIVTEINQATGDFCKDKRGLFCNDTDIFIKCANDVRIWHYGGDILQVYVPAKRRGLNMIEAIKEKAFDIETTDTELLFKIKDEDLDTVAKILKPMTNGANISPHSPRNLKREKKQQSIYMTSEQIEDFRGISARIPKEGKFLLIQINKKFIESFLSEKLGVTVKEISEEIKKLNIKQADYFCRCGYWDEYIKFLTGEVDKVYGTDFN